MTSEGELEQRRAATLTRQLHAGAWVAIAVATHLTLTSLIFDAPAYPIDYWTRPGAVLIALGLLWALRLPPGTIAPTRLALTSSVLFCTPPALAGGLGGDFVGNAMMIALVALVAGALFPWGVRTQACLALMLLAMLLAARSWSQQPFPADGGAGVMNAVTGALLISVLIALRTQNQFERMVHEAIALQRARDEIQQLNAGLEATVRARTEQLETAFEDQRSFAYAVSHDIRQPLRHVDGYLHLFQEQHPTQATDDTNQDNLLVKSHRALRRAGRMIDSLLELSRVGSSTGTQDPVDLAELAREVTANFQDNAPERQVTVTIAETMPCHGNPKLLALLLRQLLDNSWKFTRDVKDATISVQREADGSYAISDNGIGFDMRYADKLFGTFQRLHNLEDYSGEGVGLATAERIVRHHNGRIWAESEPGQGTTLRFTLHETEE